MLDKQEQRDAEEEREPPNRLREERPFDPWEQAFNRDFQKKEHDFEFQWRVGDGL
ncbi:hypothetical protein IB277_04120 [Ensifer sp. ENS07]|uniref:hypothetical protein n=1 Tax=Ensifer sp. ENS07 TaxID=2769274 RepID=UPI00177BFA0B|nr:hypothetical protein [Ensifer sp. ENS07]MBD9635488.1 hypothetical protein [Ensifer sp. ENS07]